MKSSKRWTRRMCGMALMAAMVLGIGLAASASASLPELGRCVLVPKGTGEFVGRNCNHPSPGNKGEYNFLSGAVKNKFEGSTITTVLLETAKLKISCAAATFNGEWTGPKTASVTVDLIGCLNKATKHKCQSNPLKEGEIEPAEPLKGDLGFITTGEKPTVGLDLTKENGIVAFNCGEPGESELAASLEGSVIAQIKKIGVMTPEFTLPYKVLEGKQVPEAFAGGAKDTLIAKILKGVESSTEGATLKGTAVLPDEEALEIKAVV